MSALDDFLDAYAQDDNEWWRRDSGELLNLFEEVIDRLRAVEADRDTWKGQIVTVRGQQNRALRERDEVRAALRRVGDEHFVCHRFGGRCTWNGCPNRHDDQSCSDCFLIGGKS